MRLDAEAQAITVLEAIRDCLKPDSGMAHLPDVVAICVLCGFTRPNAYNFINRWNNQYWRKIGTSIGFISKT